MDNLTFLPVLARHCKTAVAQLCDQYQFDIPSEFEDSQSKSSFESWWKTYLPEQETDAEPVEVIPLLKQMLLTSSLVLTSLPQQLSLATLDSHLIILR